ncbi:MAG: hypothetical protein M1831_001373 [Alyxoria varia]|nr:MAG: hypothetical protein M1831_001373 [Alyxoria varia]
MPINASVKQALELIAKDKSKVLGLSYGSKSIETEQYIPRSEAQSPPEISFLVPKPSKTYMCICLDLDAPSPSFSVLGPILHWIQPGFRVSQSADNRLTSSDPFIVDYIGPAPPPMSATHRYVFFLYEEAGDFDGKKHVPVDGKSYPKTSRMRYDLDAWIQTADLGELVAMNYFKSN